MNLTKNGLTIQVPDAEVVDLVLERLGSTELTGTRSSQGFAMPSLNEGEYYAGVILGKDDAPSHHLILLPSAAEDVNWEQAKEWAAKAGGELPTRREQSLLYANLAEQFKAEWYWSCEQHAAGSDYAWLQHFGDVYQDYSHKSYYYLRARAVRRLVIR